MTGLPVHALITSPAEHAVVPSGPVLVRGIAWGGTGGIAGVEVSVGGRPWRPADRRRPESRYGRTHWNLRVALAPGGHAISCRARDGAGNAQPLEPPPNPDGYANNSVHRVTVRAEEA